MQLPSILRRTIPAATVMVLLCAAALHAADHHHRHHYLITNNDNSQGNTATVYRIFHDGSLRQVQVVNTGGTGVDGIGSVATKRVSALDTSQRCVYLADAGSADVAGISIDTLAATGTFKAAATDTAPDGMAVVNNGTYLYASFTGSNTIATYRIQPGCQLLFLQDVPAAGVNGSAVLDMAVHGNILVASFSDGSIESFNVASGLPVSNGDLQLSTGNTQDGSFVSGVDITADGHFAIFGGTNVPPLVEVSNISSGKLTPTTVYSGIGAGGGSEAIWLSPDETLLYLSDFSSNQVTAAFFDKATGSVSFGCTGTLRGIGFEAGLATASPTGTGSTLYVAEPDSNIGFVTITENSGTCSLVEDPTSPVNDANTITVDSIVAFPPRPF